jgi:hypothetical protein
VLEALAGDADGVDAVRERGGVAVAVALEAVRV